MTEKTRIDGVVDEIITKTKKYALVIQERKYWGWLPAQYNDGEPVMGGHHVVLDYEDKDVNGYILKNIVGKPEKMVVEGKTNTPPQRAPASEQDAPKTNTPPKVAGKPTLEEALLDVKELQGKCIALTSDNLKTAGKELGDNGFARMVNSTIIDTRKLMNGGRY